MQHIGSKLAESQILIMIRITGICRTVIGRAGLAQRGKIFWGFSQKGEEREMKQLKLGAVGKSSMRAQLMSSNHSNIPSARRELAAMESISNQGLSIDLAIFMSQSQPAFIRDYIQQSSLAKTVRYYNPHLTNGGDAYDEFPLIKLLSIALRKIEEEDVETSSWKMLEFYIRKRLHRCTIQENLKLLYIMLKVFPRYAFDYGFIMSICLALKKEIGIMSSDELKMLFYVLHTNRNEAKRYNNSVIANIQTIILTKVLEKCEKKLVLQQQSKHVHLPIEYLYSWITFGLVLSVRNNQQDLVFEQRTIELISHFNNRWQAAVLKEQPNRIIHQSQIATTLYLLSIFDKLIRFYEGTLQKDKNKEKVKIVFKEEFSKLKVNVVAHTSRKISRLVEKSEALHSIRTLRVLLQLYSFEIVENLLEVPEAKGDTALEEGRYSKIMHFFANVMKYQQSNKDILTEKVKLLSNLYNKALISYPTLKTYYLSLDLKTIDSDCTLQMAHQLILLELYLFTEEQQFSPQPQTVHIILAFLEHHSKTYRHFDWHSFHFVTCLLNKQRHSSNPTLSTNLPANNFQQSDTSLKATKILQRLIQEVKFYNTDKLIQQQITSMAKKPEIGKIQKFFIEIRVNEMKQLQPVLAPFNRLPHFSNIKQKIAVNSLTEEELMMAEHRLQKKLMNLSGWRVVNLNCDEFVELSLNQRLRMVAEKLQREGKQVDQLREKLEYAKGESDDWLLK